jgi:ArsR family transcriptional regulator, arsenate/arsenite/antimonite-responsive transcriptional repressor
MNSFLNLTRALSDENRLRALLALEGRELCVCQIIELLELAPSTVSKHMSILKQAGLVEGQKRGRWMYYRQPDAEAPAEARQALEFVRACLLQSQRTRQDQRRLSAILKLDRDTICRRQAGR